MGEKFLIDTNVLIDFQMNILSPKADEYIDSIINENFTISFVSYIEFLGYKNVIKAMEDFVLLAEVNKVIIDQTILLRKSYRIKLPDAIIAATAIVSNLTLISRNTKDFERIQGLKILNPYIL